MPDVVISTADLLAALDGPNEAALRQGVLDDQQVLFTYHTQEDDAVRPSHAALNGTVWRVGDPRAPIPPIDFGCRCFLSYGARKGAAAAKHLPVIEAEPTTQADAWGSYLDDHVERWPTLLEQVAKLPLSDRLGSLALKIQAETGKALSDSRDLAKMALSVEGQP